MQKEFALIDQSISALMGFADVMGEVPHRHRQADTLRTLCLELEWRVGALRAELDESAEGGAARPGPRPRPATVNLSTVH